MKKLKRKVRSLQMDVNFFRERIENLENEKFQKKRLQMRLFRFLITTSVVITTIVYVYDTFTK